MTPGVRRTILAAVTMGIALTIVALVLAPGAGDPLRAAGSRPDRSPESQPSAVPVVPPAPGATISADVVVYGATPSGILAAVSAARLGASVVLATPDAQVGGMMSSGLGHADVGRPGLIGGLTRDVFDRLARAEGQTGVIRTFGWNYEPHVAAAVFDELLKDAHVSVYLNMGLDRTRPPELQGDRIVDIAMTNGTRLRGMVFVDATYEGDLMAAAGVPYAIGREGQAAYGESLAGVRVNLATPPSTLVSGIDRAGNPLPGVDRITVVNGSSDDLVQSATFRLCVTDDPLNRLAFARPADYDPASYALVGRAIAKARDQAGAALKLTSILSFARLPERKFDLNSLGLYSTNLLGGASGWAAANDAGRQVIWEQHRTWEAGLLWYLAKDPAVPAMLRRQMAPWGLCADEFRSTGGWPPDLYIREARRMVGDVVLTQRDVQTDITKPDPIAVGTYRIDAHPVRRILGSDGLVREDGQLSGTTAPYQIPYAATVPPAGSVDNLLVSVTISASHVAWSSIRVEPTLMEIGEAAGVAAAVAAREGVGVRDVGYEVIRAVLLARGGILSVPPAGAPPAIVPLRLHSVPVAGGSSTALTRSRAAGSRR